MTLGQLLNTLNNLKGSNLKISAGEIISYRGSYENMCFDTYSEKELSVVELLDYIESNIGKKVTGYKGGEFVIELESDIFVAGYGLTGGLIESINILENEASFNLNYDYL